MDAFDNRFSPETADFGGDDLPGNRTTPAVLTINATTEGDISTTSDQDWYKVTLTAGQVYQFTLSGLGAQALQDAFLTLYTVSNEVYPGSIVSVTDNNSGTGQDAYITFTPNTTGTFFLAASGFMGAQGHYGVTVRTAVDDIPGDTTTTRTVAAGQSVTSTLTHPGDMDGFRIDMVAGQAYRISATGLSVDNLPGAEYLVVGLNSINGTSYQTIAYDQYNTAGSGAYLYVIAPSTGTFLINVGNYNTGGGYRLSVTQEPVNDVSNINAGAQAVTLGAVVNGVIERNTDTDVYAVYLEAGQTYSVRTEGVGDFAINPTTYVYGPDGGGLGVGGDLSQSGLLKFSTFTATTTGTHYVQVRSFPSGVTTGDYTLQVSRAPDAPATTTTTSVLEVGRTLEATLTDRNDVDYTRIDLVAGQTYVFSLEAIDQLSSSWKLDSALKLLSADGTVLLSDDNSGYGAEAQIVFTATTSGTYFLAASSGATWASNPAGAWAYRLQAEAVTDAVGQTTQTAQALPDDASVAGTLDYQSDLDWYGFTAAAGQTFNFAVGNGENRVGGQAVALGVIDRQGNFQTVQGTHFTATTAGSYYVVVGASDNIPLTGALSYRVTLSVIDAIGSGLTTNGRISVGQTVTGSIDFLSEYNVHPADTDTYAITLEAGQNYEFSLTGSGIDPANDVNLALRNAAGNYLYLPQLTSADGLTDRIQFHAEVGGTYYLEATGTNDTGTYSLSAVTTRDIFDSRATDAVLTIGGSQTSRIDTATDKDWFRVDLVKGQSYIFTVEQIGTDPLGDPFVWLYDVNGNSIGFDDDGGIWPNSLLRYTATADGPLYVAAAGFEGAVGNYRISAQAVGPQDPLNTIDWGTQLPNATIRIYFAGSGQTFDGNTASRAWTATEIEAFMAAARTWSNVANLTFSVATTAAEATMIMVLDSTIEAAGFMDTPPQSPAVGVFKPFWGQTAITPGSAAWATIIHELGHGLGLAHPHDTGGESEIMEGVYGSGSFGTYLLNQGVFTVMSYNAGWYGASIRASATSGHEATPMALDIAVVQEKYGAVAQNATDTVYSLPTVASGFTAIWDTGGTDTLTSLTAATLDLRAATLLNAIGGGGYVSFNQYGGFTIAHGVVIENATGSAFNDTLIGNDSANILTGNAGNDTIYGGGGDDTLSGGDGTDTISFEYARNGVRFDLSVNGVQDTGEGRDTVSGFENFRGSAFNDTLTLSTGANIAYGGAGTDTLILTGNFSNYTIEQYSAAGAPYQFRITSVAGGVDMVYEFELFQFADQTITAAKLVNSKPILIANSTSLIVDEGGVVALSAANLSYTDEDNEPEEITYVVSTAFDGNILLNGQPATRFTHAQLAAGLVSYQHGGASVTSAQVWLQVGDLSGITQGVAATLNFTVVPGIADRVIGDDTPNQYHTGSGKDYVETRGGSDIVRGGAGDDEIHGGTGEDQLFGDAGDDVIYGDEGFDYIVGGDGNDRLFGGAGDDFLLGEGGYDYMEGGDGEDHLFGFDGDDTMYGGAGADRLIGGGGRDIMYGGEGDDVIVGEEGDDLIYGGNGYSYLHGGLGNDYIVGGDQADFIVGAEGNDNLTGGAGDDQLYGDDGNDNIQGNDGNDLIVGGAGNDYISGQNGDDIVFAQDGDDTVNGGEGNDNLYGQSGNDVLEGWGGNDVLLGGDGKDTIYGHTGNDSLYGENDDDVLYGYEDDDLLSGGAGNDRLYGGSGRDVIYGDAGDDLIQGEGGNDYLIGGSGRDSFIFDRIGPAGEYDTIADFNVADDSIGLSLSVFKELLARTGGNVLLETQFVLGTAATTAAQRVIYDSQTGSLYYDADGSGAGAAIEIARIENKAALTADDFLLV